jgi:hypothetical protein
MLFYAIICRFLPKKLVAMAVVFHIKNNKLDDRIPVYEFIDKIG